MISNTQTPKATTSHTPTQKHTNAKALIPKSISPSNPTKPLACYIISIPNEILNLIIMELLKNFFEIKNAIHNCYKLLCTGKSMLLKCQQSCNQKDIYSILHGTLIIDFTAKSIPLVTISSLLRNLSKSDIIEDLVNNYFLEKALDLFLKIKTSVDFTYKFEYTQNLKNYCQFTHAIINHKIEGKLIPTLTQFLILFAYNYSTDFDLYDLNALEETLLLLSKHPKFTKKEAKTFIKSTISISNEVSKRAEYPPQKNQTIIHNVYQILINRGLAKKYSHFIVSVHLRHIEAKIQRTIDIQQNFQIYKDFLIQYNILTNCNFINKDCAKTLLRFIHSERLIYINQEFRHWSAIVALTSDLAKEFLKKGFMELTKSNALLLNPNNLKLRSMFPTLI